MKKCLIVLDLEQRLRDHDAAASGQAVSDLARQIALAPLAVRLAMVGAEPLADGRGSRVGSAR
jgi:hypothetical protein